MGGAQTKQRAFTVPSFPCVRNERAHTQGREGTV